MGTLAAIATIATLVSGGIATWMKLRKKKTAKNAK